MIRSANHVFLPTMTADEEVGVALDQFFETLESDQSGSFGAEGRLPSECTVLVDLERSDNPPERASWGNGRKVGDIAIGTTSTLAGSGWYASRSRLRENSLGVMTRAARQIVRAQSTEVAGTNHGKYSGYSRKLIS